MSVLHLPLGCSQPPDLISSPSLPSGKLKVQLPSDLSPQGSCKIPEYPQQVHCIVEGRLNSQIPPAAIGLLACRSANTVAMDTLVDRLMRGLIITSCSGQVTQHQFVARAWLPGGPNGQGRFSLGVAQGDNCAACDNTCPGRCSGSLTSPVAPTSLGQFLVNPAGYADFPSSTNNVTNVTQQQV